MNNGTMEAVAWLEEAKRATHIDQLSDSGERFRHVDIKLAQALTYALQKGVRKKHQRCTAMLGCSVSIWP